MKQELFVLSSMAEALGRTTMVEPMIDISSPIFYPKKHTVMSYAKQNRLAKQGRRKNGRKK